MRIEKPFILIIDDDPDRVRAEATLLLAQRAVAHVVHPKEIELPDLNRADLVLVDYVLDKWEARDAQSVISLKPGTGMALTVILREHADRPPHRGLTAFALHTGHLRDIQGRLPPQTAQHVIACLNNLEWVFPKDEARRYEQMVDLARAVRKLPKEWPQCPNESTSRVRRLLALNKKHKWFDRCWREVRECRVPIHELSEGGHGILFVRWLLHQILPYPSFLWAEDWVAARLQISVMALREVISGDSPLARDLLSMRYSGILAGFLGDRWWRGALEDYVWRLTSNRSTEGRSLRIALADRAKMDLDHIDPEATVVGLDANWEPTGSFLSPTNAVSLRPDHWPAFADSAWVDFQTVRNDPRLMALVDPLDSYRFGDFGNDEEE